MVRTISDDFFKQKNRYVYFQFVMKNLGKFEVMLMAITLTKSRYRHMDFLPAVAGDSHVIVIKNDLEHDYDFDMYIQVHDGITFLEIS